MIELIPFVFNQINKIIFLIWLQKYQQWDNDR